MPSETVALPASARRGPEMDALAPFYRDWTWTGTIEAGGMGPGTPAMSGEGRATCRLIQDGLWYRCDFVQDQHLSDGTFVLRWQLTWLAGWDDGRASTAPAARTTRDPTLASTAAGSRATG